MSYYVIFSNFSSERTQVQNSFYIIIIIGFQHLPAFLGDSPTGLDDHMWMASLPHCACSEAARPASAIGSSGLVQK